MADYTFRSDIAPARSGVNITVSDGRYHHANMNTAFAKFTAGSGGVSSGTAILMAELPRGAVVAPAQSYILGGAASGSCIVKAGGTTIASGVPMNSKTMLTPYVTSGGRLLIESGMEEITIVPGSALASGTTIELGIAFASLT